MRLRRGAAGGLALIVLAGCGATPTDQAWLTWKSRPAAFSPRTLPTDRVVLGTVRNASKRAWLVLDASQVHVVDAGGRRLRGSAQFIASYAHGIYGAYQKPVDVEESELLRLGLKIKLAPGRTAPLYVSYRLRPGLKLPVHVDYGSGTLPLPARAKTD